MPAAGYVLFDGGQRKHPTVLTDLRNVCADESSSACNVSPNLGCHVIREWSYHTRHAHARRQWPDVAGGTVEGKQRSSLRLAWGVLCTDMSAMCVVRLGSLGKVVLHPALRRFSAGGFMPLPRSSSFG